MFDNDNSFVPSLQLAGPDGMWSELTGDTHLLGFGMEDQEPCHEHENDSSPGNGWCPSLLRQSTGNPSLSSSPSSRDSYKQNLWLDDCLDPEYAASLKRHFFLMIFKIIHHCLSVRVKKAGRRNQVCGFIQ